VGFGGIYAEVLRDFQLLVAPASPASITSAALTPRSGVAPRSPRCVTCRSRRCLRRDAAARISNVAAAHPSISEIEVNPLLAHPAGAIALDARVLPAPEAHEQANPVDQPT
jgi:hypothetical protein